MSARCNICRFWVPAHEQPRNRETLHVGDGECRRRAPGGGAITAYFHNASKQPNKMIAISYPWPITHEADWCAEYEAAS